MASVTVRVVDCYVYLKTDDDLKFLLLKRNKNKIYEHLWQGVAGKIEEGETAPEAAIRELKEETGLDPVNMFVADHVSRFYEVHGDRVNLVPVFGIEVDSEEVMLSEEHVDFKWVNISEALNTLVWNGQKEGIQMVYDMVKSNDDRMRWSRIELE
jgi:dATP pyrophosphohydrolase